MTAVTNNAPCDSCGRISDRLRGLEEVASDGSATLIGWYGKKCYQRVAAAMHAAGRVARRKGSSQVWAPKGSRR
jgi:hypothetical protein